MDRQDHVTEPQPAAVDCAVEAIIAATREKRDLESRVRALNARIEQAAQAISGAWLASGTQRMTRHGATVYLSREMSVATGDGIIAALRSEGLDAMLAVGHPRLKAWLKEIMHDDALGEWVADPARIPEALRPFLTIDEYHRVNVKGA